MSSSLNPLKELWGIIQGSIVGVIKGDARSFHYSLYDVKGMCRASFWADHKNNRG